jgi:hypothetical protein
MRVLAQHRIVRMVDERLGEEASVDVHEHCSIEVEQMGFSRISM